jgi:D-lactate dehydrogenase
VDTRRLRLVTGRPKYSREVCQPVSSRPSRLSPNLRIMTSSAHTPQRDRAPDALAAGTPPGLRDDLVALLGADCVLTRPIDLIRFATDASPYRLFPKVIVIARNVGDVRKVLEYARREHESVTFRSAGTSLSGQAQGDGILVDVKRHWSGVGVEAEGQRLRARPGTILTRANLVLLTHGYRLGPDPASASACTIGGVIANNSSGMCCGTTQNSYKTLSSLTFMLPSGTLIDSAGRDAEQQFAASEPALAAGLMEIKREIESDPELVARLHKKFSIKNTTGYHMEAFLDGSTPLEIFRRLIVGSEGTLAFISSVGSRTGAPV